MVSDQADHQGPWGSCFSFFFVSFFFLFLFCLTTFIVLHTCREYDMQRRVLMERHPFYLRHLYDLEESSLCHVCYTRFNGIIFFSL